MIENVGEDAEQQTGGKKTSTQFLQYTAFSLVGFAIEAVLLALLTHVFSVNPYLARIPTWLTNVLVTWPLNRKVTFRGESSSKWHRELAKYGGSQAVGAISNIAVYMGVLALWRKIPSPVIALMIGSFVGYVINFTLSKVYVFGNGMQQKQAEGSGGDRQV